MITAQTTRLASLLFTILVSQGAAGSLRTDTVATAAPWSQRIADSFLLRHPGAVTYDTGFTEMKWNYEQGLMLWALCRMWQHTGDDRYVQFVEQNLDQHIEDDGTIRLYKRSDYNLDLIAPGRALLMMYKRTKNPKYLRAADSLRQQLRGQPRTHEGGFWHKKIYPYQMWLDGLYMAEPFYAMYAKEMDDSPAFTDIAHQFLWAGLHMRDSTTGLFYHGWDESRAMAWADPITGCSPSFWGRSMGWFGMGLVDVLDYFPEHHPLRKRLEDLLRSLCEALLRWRDRETNLWRLVVDQGDRPGNYLESSCSGMFTYVFARGARKGYLAEQYLAEARRSFEGLVKHEIKIDGNGFVNLYNTIKGAGLGGNPYRDGTFSYYASEARRTNDMKGVGPLLLAAIELEHTGSHKDRSR
jgi:unsaturated rhamnogalacturonyl hydrolase